MRILSRLIRKSQREEPWYARGVRFECQQCGECCGGAPGYVWLAQRDVERISAFLNTSHRDFTRLFCREVRGKLSLIERPNYDCVFRTPEGCRIYPVRPHQCRTFPFWPHLVRKRRRWESLKSRCPGAGCGKLYSQDEIEAIVAGVRST